VSTFLVDNSIWQKAGRSDRIAARLRELSPQHLLITCPPQVLEYCHSARTPSEYAALRQDMSELLPAALHPSTSEALDLQQHLWTRGYVRAAGALYCLIAAYAVVNDATLLHSDRDFEYIAAATNGLLRQEYVTSE
jgi:predicted nucleic acid-binding protein